MHHSAGHNRHWDNAERRWPSNCAAPGNGIAHQGSDHVFVKFSVLQVTRMGAKISGADLLISLLM